MNIFKKFFHRHIFEPNKWVLIHEEEVFEVRQPTSEQYFYSVSSEEREAKETRIGKVFMYSNTCQICGDLVFKKVTSTTRS